MAKIRNYTITTGGVAQTLTVSDNIFGFAFYASEEDTWVMVSTAGTAAASGTGVLVPAGTSSNFERRRGETVSVFGATTGKKFAIQEV